MESDEKDVKDEMQKIDNFFTNFKEPSNLLEVKERVEQFIKTNQSAPIVLITVWLISNNPTIKSNFLPSLVWWNFCAIGTQYGSLC